MSKPSAPDTKQIQYDRQLRLWGDHGQKALEAGRVCLIGANAVGTEILKALVLPGLGSFTIIDHQLVTIADCGSNFFVHPSKIDQSRAHVTCEFLKQLNPDVHGAYIDKPSIDDLLKQNTFDFTQFNVVIAANVPWPTLVTLSNHLWTLKIPLLVARTYGFIGTIRLQVVEHYIIEAHPDDTIPDLRLDRPLKQFVNHCNSINFSTLTREEHLHIPSLIILYKTLQQWQTQTNRTDLPRVRKERDEFKQLLDQLSHHSAYEISDSNKSLENFDEAKRVIPSRLVNTIIPSAVKKLFEDRSCLELSHQSHMFWFIINAMKLFTENEGQGLLPVRGEVPDMVTNTSSYVKLVEIYNEQARKDCETVHNYLIDLLKQHNRFSTMTSNEQATLHDLVHIYCKNASFLNILRTTSIKNEDDSLRKQIEQFPLESSSDESESDISWYIGLRLCDSFYEKFNRYPGEFPLSTNDINTDQRQVEIDFNDLKQIGRQLLNSDKHQGSLRENILEELCRYGASEIHSISAFIGGCCAQEAIKLITHQYTPVDDVLVYNGIRQSASVFKL